MSEGKNVITVTVTAADKATMDTYTVTVTRVPSSLSTKTTLTALSLTYDDNGTDTSVSLMPRFTPDRAPREGGYTAETGSTVATVELTANASHSDATVAVMRGEGDDASLVTAGDEETYPVTLEFEGLDTVIMVMVTAQDGVSKANYKVTVERGPRPDSGVTLLSALSLMAGGNKVMLDPEFASGTDEYTASVAYATSRVEVMATPTNRGATAAVTSDKDSNVQNNVVDLSEGKNVITVTVTAADKATMGCLHGDGDACCEH